MIYININAQQVLYILSLVIIRMLPTLCQKVILAMIKL
ncbi:putative membrane protein [Ehrlichia cf. muris str. EmCRT]|uniref:Putative membrane protein n=1 Tax=Ehrlichia cf. muris str. EmCRT TaxID=1359167 RepID=A0A0F3N5Q0_9RICK|nr:putative membrane protein [Ehrlichia cf. muris str. EmCRT]